MTDINCLDVSVEVFRYLRKLHDLNKFEKVRDTANLFEDLYYREGLGKKDGLPSEQDRQSVSDAIAIVNRRYSAMCSDLMALRQQVIALHHADNDDK